jgi:hypothetical protein
VRLNRGTPRASLDVQSSASAAWHSATLPRLISSDECEAKYFLLKDIVAVSVDLSDLKKSRIRQDYFSEQAFKNLIPALLRSNGRDDLDPKQFRQARLRVEQTAIGAVHSVELKGPRNDWHRRQEVTIAISEDFYRLLKQFAFAGTIEKIRYYLPVEVRSKREVLGKAEAHIDFIIGAGKGSRFSLRDDPHWCTIDLESSKYLLPYIRRGQIDHSWIVLGGIELIRSADLPQSITQCQRALATRRIAKAGFDQEAARAVKKLSRLSEN